MIEIFIDSLSFLIVALSVIYFDQSRKHLVRLSELIAVIAAYFGSDYFRYEGPDLSLYVWLRYNPGPSRQTYTWPACVTEYVQPVSLEY